MYVEMKHRLIAFLAIRLKESDPWWIKSCLYCMSNPVGCAHCRSSFLGCQIEQGRRMALDGNKRVSRVQLAHVHEDKR